MVQLSLTEPTWNYNGDGQSVKERVSFLNKLESIVWSLLMSSGGRSEARLWLCNTLSGISSITPCCQRELFVNLLMSKPLKQGLAAQLLRMIFKKQPQKAGSIIAKKSYKLDNFFRGNPRRILHWFSNFSVSGDVNHRRGARALSQFAFVNRDICWEELEWKGKHGQSPAMVATNPHYFLDLDVQRTVENFLEYVPEFWSSNEFAESLKDGEIFVLDTDFFVRMFVDLMYEEDLEEIWDIINEFLMEESYSSLCNHLLIILEERDLCVFLDLIRKCLNPKMDVWDFGNPSFWLEIVLSKCGGSDSLDELLLLNAVIGQGRQLLRLLCEEESEEEKVKIKDIVSEICTSSSHANTFAYIMQTCVITKTLESIKLLGLQSWALHYILSEEKHTLKFWESLFISNGIGFRKSNKYALLDNNHCSEETGSDFDERASIRDKRKKKEKHRKRRRRRRATLDHDDSYDNELLGFDLSNSKLDSESKLCSWLLSTDGYSTSWSSVDLPEHLSRHCFSAWMKWVSAKWTGVS
ncbi:hypothetical protein LguiA_020724 [Lonicera macranthoides]